MKKIYIAPMAGVTDYTYRKILSDYNPDMIYTEMVSVNALSMVNQKTIKQILKLNLNRKQPNISNNEITITDNFAKSSLTPEGVQIFGKDIDHMKESANYIQNLGVKNIDINIGCPMQKIIKNGYGAALLADPEHTKLMMKEIKSVLNNDVNLSMKIRIGYKEHKNPLEMLEIAEEIGCSHLTVHGRTREQLYSGKANWDVIKNIKSNATIPIIGNGDIFTPYDALNKIEESDVDGIMIARGIYGNPFLITQIRELLSTGKISSLPSAADKIDLAIKHLKLSKEDYPDKEFYIPVRKHLGWYLKGLKNINPLKEKIYVSRDYNEIIELLERYKRINCEY